MVSKGLKPKIIANNFQNLCSASTLVSISKPVEVYIVLCCILWSCPFFFAQIFYYLTGEGEGNIEGDYYEIKLSTYLVEGGEFTSELS